MPEKKTKRPACTECGGRTHINARDKNGRPRYRCSPCKLYVSNPDPVAREARELRRAHYPYCVPCRVRMQSNGFVRAGVLRWRCPRCVSCYRSGTLRQVAPELHVRARWLLRLVERILPVNIPSEVRDEARQALLTDFLAHDIKRRDLDNPMTVRRYVRAAYGFNDSKRFISLDQPTRGSSTFGALMVG